MVFARFPCTFFRYYISYIFFLVFCSLIGWYHDFLVKHKMLWVSLLFLNSFKSLITSFFLYLSGVGQKLRFLFNSLFWYFQNENFDRLITFLKGSIQYRFAFSIAFRKRLIFTLFGEKILKFGLLKFFLGLCCWQRLRVHFLFLAVYWDCFVSLVMVMMVGLVIGGT